MKIRLIFNMLMCVYTLAQTCDCSGCVSHELTLIKCLTGSLSGDCKEVCLGLMSQTCDVISWGSSQQRSSDREPHPEPGCKTEAEGNENIYSVKNSREGFYKFLNFRQGLILHQTQQDWEIATKDRVVGGVCRWVGLYVSQLVLLETHHLRSVWDLLSQC